MYNVTELPFHCCTGSEQEWSFTEFSGVCDHYVNAGLVHNGAFTKYNWLLQKWLL